MTRFFPSFLIWVIIIIQSLFLIKIPSCSCSSWRQHHHHHHIHQHTNRKFEQKTTIFWEFEEQSKTWVQVKLPYHLLSCVNDNKNCTKVGIIEPINQGNNNDQTRMELDPNMDDDGEIKRKKKMKKDERKFGVLASRKRISLIKMSEDSIWVTGVSGSIYERFWNGVQWVIAPHQLPVQAGYAVSIFLVNHTVFALSEAGILYQLAEMQKTEDLQWVWWRMIGTPTSRCNTIYWTAQQRLMQSSVDCSIRAEKTLRATV